MNTVENYSQRPSQRASDKQSQIQDQQFEEFMSLRSQEPVPDDNQKIVGYDRKNASSQSPETKQKSLHSDLFVKEFSPKQKMKHHVYSYSQKIPPPNPLVTCIVISVTCVCVIVCVIVGELRVESSVALFCLLSGH